MSPLTQSLCYPRALSVDPSAFVPRPVPVSLPTVTLPRPRSVLAAIGLARATHARKDYGRQPLASLTLPARHE